MNSIAWFVAGIVAAFGISTLVVLVVLVVLALSWRQHCREEPAATNHSCTVEAATLDELALGLRAAAEDVETRCVAASLGEGAP